MSQAGYTPIQLYFSTTAAAVPVNTNLANGELAINITDGKLYYKDNTGTVKLLAGATAGPAGGSNTQVQFNSSGVLAGSANMTFNGTTLTVNDITDSSLTVGRVTFAGTAGNLTDSANLFWDNTNGRLGIGTSTPPVKLVVGAATGAQNTLRIYGDNTTSNAPVLSLFRTAARESAIAQTNTGMVFANTGGLANYLDTTIDAAANLIILNSGNVGIGTSSPNFKLETQTAITVGVTGTNLANNTAVNSAFIYTDPGSVANGDGKAIAIGMNARARVYISATHPGSSKDSSDLALWTTTGAVPSERLRVTSLGDVGIGNTAPIYRLDVSSGAEIVSRFARSGGSNAVVIIQDPTTTTPPYVASYGNSMAFGSYGGSEYGRFLSTGFLGIGTSTPSTKLHIASGAVTIANVSGSTQALLISANDPSNAGISISNTSGPRIWNIVAGSQSANNTDFTIRDVTAGATRFYIDTSGNTGIGAAPNTKLQVWGTTNSGYATSNAIVNAATSISNANALYNGSSLRLTANMGGAVNFIGRGSELVFGADNGNFGAGGGFGQANLGAITAISETGSAVNLASSMLFYTVIGNNIYERFRINSAGALGIGGANYGTAGQVLTSGGPSAAPTWAAGGGGGGSPGGSNTQVQYNSSGSFAGSANFTFNGTGITTGNVNVTSGTNPSNGMYLNSLSTSGLSFYNTGSSGGTSVIQTYYGRSSLAATTNGVANNDRQWLAFGTNATPKITTIGSTASLYYLEGHNYLISDVPSVLRINAGDRGDNTTYNCPADNGVIFVDMGASYGGNASNGRCGVFVNHPRQGLGDNQSTGFKAKNDGFPSGSRSFWALLAPSDPNGGGQPYGFYAQTDTSATANDNCAPVGLVIDNALVDNYTKINGGAQMAIWIDRRSGSTSRTAIQFSRNSQGNVVGTIQTTNSATSYNTSSDYRLKENIAPLTGAIEKVLRLKPSTYTWKVDGSAGEGFIAHELQEVIPQAVSGEKDAEKLQQVEVEHAVAEVKDEDGKIISYGKPPVFEEQMKPVYQGVDTSFLVATLTAAIQEQQAIIESLKARLDAANL